MKFRSKFLLAKIEATEDTDSSPAATDAVLTSNLECLVYQGDRISRNFDRDTLGASEEINVNPHNSLSFDVEMQSSGAAGTAPAFGAILRSCGLSETISAGVSVTYAPVSSGYESMTAHFLRLQDDDDHLVIKSTGVRGNMGIELGAGSFPMLKFSDMLGTYYSPTQQTAITANTSDFVAPLAVTKTNTATVTVDSVAACLTNFSLNLGNQIERLNAPNCRHTIIRDRRISGSLTIKAPDLSTKDYFTEMESHAGVSTVPVAITHGTVAGKIVEISLPYCQLSSVSDVDQNGDYAFNFNFIAVPTSAGDDEFSIVFK